MDSESIITPEVPKLIAGAEASATTPAVVPATTTPEVKKTKMKKWPSLATAIVPYSNLIKPLKDILETGYRLMRKNAITGFDYTGYNIGRQELFFYPNPKQRLTEKSLIKSGAKGETLFDTVLNIVFLLGIEQGRRASRIEMTHVQDLVDKVKEYRNTNNDLNRKIDLLSEEIGLRRKWPLISNADLDSEVKAGMEVRRIARIQAMKQEMAKDNHKNLFILPDQKTKFSDLVLLANSLDKGSCSKEQWESVLKDHGWTVEAWKKKCKKRNTQTNVG